MKRFLFTASQVAVAAFLTLAAAQCTLVQADEIYDWSNTAANNNNAPPDGFPENMNYSEVNDAARELMAVVKRYVEATDGTNTTGGTQPAYTLSSGQSLSTGAAGRVHVWTAHATSTGSVTLNVDAAGAKNVVDAFGTQLGSGALVQNGIYMTVEEGTNHRIIGTFSTPPISGPASSTDNAVARFNGTGGTTVQNSGIIVDDSNNVTGMGTLASGAITSSGSLTGTTVELGGVTDTTLSRPSAGDVNVEGNRIYRAGGTDVAIADGGHGQSTAALGFAALKQDATESATGVVELATTAEAETGTDTARAVTPAGVVASINANSPVAVNSVEAGALSSQATLDIALGSADMYEIDLIAIKPATDGVSLRAFFSQSAVFLSGAGDYTYGYLRAATAMFSGSSTELRITDSVGNSTNEINTITVRIFRPAASAFSKTMTWHGFTFSNSGNPHEAIGGGTLIDNTNAIDGVRFSFSSGNIASGYYAVRSYDFGD